MTWWSSRIISSMISEKSQDQHEWDNHYDDDDDEDDDDENDDDDDDNDNDDDDDDDDLDIKLCVSSKVAV